MQFKTVSQCRKDLDFKPLKVWPRTLPAFAIGDQLLSGFSSPPEAHVIDYLATDKATAAQIFLDIYPDLTWPELCRFLVKADKFEIFDLDFLLKKLNLTDSSDVMALAEKFNAYPKQLQDLCSNKKINFYDLQFLSTNYQELPVEVLLSLARSDLGKSQFLKVWEWTLDCYQMNPELPLTKILSGPDSFELVEKLRFPTTTERDQSLKELKLNWPMGVKAQFERRGDRSGFVFQGFVSSAQDLEKINKNLGRTIDHWKSSKEENP